MTLWGDRVTGQPVPFQRLRQKDQDQGGGIQEGVVNAGDLQTTQRGAGANLSVDVATGFGWVKIDTGTRNGVCHVTNDAIANVGPITTAHATLPRVDQIILRYNDTTVPTGAGNIPTLAILTGTATSTADLINRLGAAALPNDCMRLADVLVPALDTAIDNTQIRDRRPWARGAYWTTSRTAGDYTTASTSAGFVDPVNLQPRIECSGVPIRMTVKGTLRNNTAAAQTDVMHAIDGIAQGTRIAHGGTGYPAGMNVPIGAAWTLTPAAGSHLIGLGWLVSAGTATFNAAGSYPLEFTVEEVVRQNTANNTATSG
jgi:hypothetical protein